MVFYFTPAGSEFAIPWRGSFSTVEAQRDAIIRADHSPDENGMAVNRGRALYEANLGLIRAITASVCRKSRLNATDTEEFQSDVDLKFIDHGYQVLNEFQGRSALKTFLRIVITNEFRDYRNKKWGKFRPSAQAKRLGPRAITIDQLLHRDGWTPGEVFEHVRTTLGWDITRAEFDAIVAQLPWHGRRRFVSDDALMATPTTDPPADDVVARRELEEPICRLLEALERTIATLDDQERLILHFYREGKTIAWIARTMKLDQPQLYRRVQGLLKQLGKMLEEQGFDRETVRKLLDWDRL